MKLSFIVAVSKNNVIGHGLSIPWHIEGELSIFKALSYHHHVLMGRKTWESIGRPLPGRKILVLTRDAGYRIDKEDVEVVHTLDEALAIGCKEERRLVVAGGAEIFRLTLPLADTLHITHVHAEIEGDVFMPAIPETFKEVYAQHFRAKIPYTLTIYKRQ